VADLSLLPYKMKTRRNKRDIQEETPMSPPSKKPCTFKAVDKSVAESLTLSSSSGKGYSQTESTSELKPELNIEPIKDQKPQPEPKSRITKFSWTTIHDEALLQEILSQRPYAQEHGAVSKRWDAISVTLKSTNLEFEQDLSGTACTKRFNETLLKRHRSDTWKSFRASGVVEDFTKLKELLENIVDDIDDAKREKEKNVSEKDAKKAAEETQERMVRELATTRRSEKITQETTETPEGKGKEKGTRSSPLDRLEVFLEMKAQDASAQRELAKVDMELKKAQLAAFNTEAGGIKELKMQMEGMARQVNDLTTLLLKLAEQKN